MSKLKIGDRIICIKVPPKSWYQCNLGAIATIASLKGDTITTIKNISTDKHDALFACYKSYYFTKYIRTISLKSILHK